MILENLKKKDNKGKILKMKNIYHLTQDYANYFDFFSSMIVIADNLEEAILLSYERAGMLVSEEDLKTKAPFYTEGDDPLIRVLDSLFKGKYKGVERGLKAWVYEEHISNTIIGTSNSEESYVVDVSYTRFGKDYMIERWNPTYHCYEKTRMFDENDDGKDNRNIK